MAQGTKAGPEKRLWSGTNLGGNGNGLTLPETPEAEPLSALVGQEGRTVPSALLRFCPFIGSSDFSITFLLGLPGGWRPSYQQQLELYGPVSVLRERG